MKNNHNSYMQSTFQIQRCAVFTQPSFIYTYWNQTAHTLKHISDLLQR